MTSQKLYTTGEIAKAVNRHPGHIKNLALWHNLGRLIGPRSRVYDDNDLAKIRELTSVKPGRKKRDPNAPIPEDV
jgi:hypothetical protein